MHDIRGNARYRVHLVLDFYSAHTLIRALNYTVLHGID